MRRIVLPARVLLLSSLFVIAGPAWAQDCVDFDDALAQDDLPHGKPFPLPRDFRDPASAITLNLSPPGARSLAMGGAFLGLADDATAAYTNPAGLTNLAVGGAEVTVELRGTDFTSPYSDRGHYFTDPDLTAMQRDSECTFAGQDFEAGLITGSASGDTSGLSFLSFGFVLPGGLTLAVYRHEVGNFQSGFIAQGPFNDFACGEGPYENERDCDLYRALPSRSSVELEIVNYGVSAAYAFDIGSASSLSVGLGVSYYEASMQRIAETFMVCRYDFGVGDPSDFLCENDPRESRRPGTFYGPADYNLDNIFDFTEERTDDDAFGVNIGFLWKIGRERRLSIGGVFRQGPDFDTAGESYTFDDGDTDTPVFDPMFFDFVENTGGTLTVPDVVGLGVAYRTTDGRTKFAFDWNRVSYSQTLGDFTSNLGQGCLVDVDELSMCPPDQIEDFTKSYALDDVDQFHFGVERIVLVVESLFVGSARFGVWHEPNHTPQYIGLNPDLKALFGRELDDELHLSVGFGLVIKEDYQLDFAAKFSDITDTYSFSLVKFF